MRLIRFIFWIAITVCLAYFITDYKVGDKTIKEHIDIYLASSSGLELKNRATNALDKGLKGGLDFLESTKSGNSQAADKKNEAHPTELVVSPDKQNATKTEEITAEENANLEKLIKNH